MLPKALQEIVDEMHRGSKAVLKDCEDVNPTLLLFNIKNGKVKHHEVIDAQPFLYYGDAGKTAIVAMAGSFLQFGIIDAAVMVMNVFFAEVDDPTITPSECVNKQEAVLYNVLTKTEQYLVMSTIIRDDDNVVTDFGDFEVRQVDPKHASGNLIREVVQPLH